MSRMSRQITFGQFSHSLCLRPRRKCTLLLCSCSIPFSKCGNLTSGPSDYLNVRLRYRSRHITLAFNLVWHFIFLNDFENLYYLEEKKILLAKCHTQPALQSGQQTELEACHSKTHLCVYQVLKVSFSKSVRTHKMQEFSVKYFPMNGVGGVIKAKSF